MKYGAIVSLIFLCLRFSAGLNPALQTPMRALLLIKSSVSVQSTTTMTTPRITPNITVVKTTDGKKKKIVERSNGMVIAYNYLP
jgi:hypothetical protein